MLVVPSVTPTISQTELFHASLESNESSLRNQQQNMFNNNSSLSSKYCNYNLSSKYSNSNLLSKYSDKDLNFPFEKTNVKIKTLDITSKQHRF